MLVSCTLPLIRLRCRRTSAGALIALLGCVLSITLPDLVHAQASRLVSADDPAYEYISRLQRRGHLLELHPTALPYTQGEIAGALSHVKERRLRGAERHWYRMLKEQFRLWRTPSEGAHVGGSLQAGSSATNNDRLDPLRFTERGNPTLEADGVRVFPRATLQIYLDRHPFVAQLGLVHDVFYDVDPDGLDAVNRLYVRNEEAYVGVNSRYASVYLGRFAQHWAPYGEPAVLLGTNPRSFDAVTLRLGGQRLALRSTLGELDAATADGRFTGRAAESFEPGINRYLAAHRLDWRPSRSVAFSLSESAIYSGPNIGPSIKFAIPVHAFLFLIDNRPKNEEPNGLFAASAWGHHRGWTASAQVLLDDFDFLNAHEPASMAATGRLVYAANPWLDLLASAHAVTALAYNTHQAEGKYLYLLRGIGSQFSDFVHASLSAAFYPRNVPALTLEPQLNLLWQGEGDIRDPFPIELAGRETILIGTVERTTRVGVRLRYQPDPRLWAGADVGMNWTQNDAHLRGAREARFVGVVEFGARLSLNRRYRLAL